MFNSRRVQRVQEPEYEALPETPFDDWARSADPMEDLARQVEQDLNAHARSGHAQLSAVEAIAAELEASIAAEHPKATRGRVARTYDPWDDEALSALPGEMAFQEAEPERVEEGVLPVHPEDAARESRRRKRVLLAASAAVAIGLAVTGGWWLVRDGVGPLSGEPTLVQAPTAPWKIVPEKGDAIDEPVEGAAVFDQVQGVPAKKEERLVTREEQVPALPGVTPQVSRVILPDGQAVETEAPEAISPADAGPRRVRTVLVKPNGDIIETPQKPVALPAPTDLAPPAPTTDAIAALADGETPVQSVDEEGSAAGLPPIPSADQSTVAEPPPATVDAPMPVAVAETPTVPAVADAAPADALPDAQPAGQDAISAEALLPPSPDAAAPKPKPAAAARVSHDGPLDLAATAAGPAPEPAPIKREVAAVSPDPATIAVPDAPVTSAPAPAGRAYVQVSSQRSEAAALSAFQAMQRKYPRLLGGLSPDIQKADLGSKGVYYRARVPAASRDVAATLCEQLRAAGGDCVIARK